MTLPAGIALRDAHPDDLEAIVSLMSRDASAAPIPAPTADHHQAFETIQWDPAHRLIVAVMGDDVVGCMQVVEIPDLATGRRRLQLADLRVAPEQRNRGIGSSLVRWAVHYGEGRDCTAVQLLHDRRCDRLARFYAGLGFEPSHAGYAYQP